MELFKTDLLNRECNRFQNEVLIDLLECGLCQSFSCGESHKKNSFLVVIDVEKPGVNLV